MKRREEKRNVSLNSLLSFLLAVVFVIGLFPVGVLAADDGIAINETNFPDDSFRAYVSEKCDKDSDGCLSDDEIKAVTGIDVSSKSIADLTGVGYFYRTYISELRQQPAYIT